MTIKEKAIDSTFFAKIATISSYVWLVSTIAFVVVILLSTGFLSKDPSYSPGGAEEAWLIPMLASLFVGVAAFGSTLLFGVLRKILKAQKWQAPLGFGAGKAGLAAFLVTAFFLVFVIGSFRQAVSFGGGYSGQEIFNAVNEHRQRVGVSPVTMNEFLCDNLVNRWRVVKGGEFHQGFEEWVKEEGLQTQYGFKEIGEIVISAPTPRDAVYWWSTSPGHKSVLEGTRWTDACAYAAEGSAVMVFGYK